MGATPCHRVLHVVDKRRRLIRDGRARTVAKFARDCPDPSGALGLTEIIDAQAAAASDNGAAFGGPKANTPRFITSRGFVMPAGA